MFHVSRNHQTVSHRGCPIPHSRQQCTRRPDPPHPGQHGFPPDPRRPSGDHVASHRSLELSWWSLFSCAIDQSHLFFGKTSAPVLCAVLRRTICPCVAELYEPTPDPEYETFIRDVIRTRSLRVGCLFTLSMPSTF